MRELAKARHSIPPYPPVNWNDSNVWDTFMEEVLDSDLTLKKRNEVMTIVYNLEKIFLEGGVNRFPEKLHVLMNTVFGPMNADEGSLRTYALDPSILPAQLSFSDVPELGIPKIDDDNDDDEEEECVELVQNVRKKSKFPKVGSLDCADVFTRRRHFEAGNSSQDFRKPNTTVISTQQMALVYHESTKHLEAEDLASFLCHIPAGSLQFQNISMQPLSDRPSLVSRIASEVENVGSHIQRPSSPKYFTVPRQCNDKDTC